MTNSTWSAPCTDDAKQVRITVTFEPNKRKVKVQARQGTKIDGTCRTPKEQTNNANTLKSVILSSAATGSPLAKKPATNGKSNEQK